MPQGLWLSDERSYGWSHKCHEAECFLEKLNHQTKFRLDMKNILVLDSESKISSLTKSYCIDRYSEPLLTPLNWENIKKEYSGVYISNYNREHDTYLWYMKWDCNSACIWDLSVVKPFSN